jgi:hypothetical protein
MPHARRWGHRGFSTTFAFRLRTGGFAAATFLAWAVLAVFVQGAHPSEQRFPDVLEVVVRQASDGAFDFDVTVSSPYDTPERYADGFRVTTTGGRVLGERTLWHDHQNEQPFTRDLHGVAIPPDIQRVLVQARDRQYGYGGKAVEVDGPVRLPSRGRQTAGPL